MSDNATEGTETLDLYQIHTWPDSQEFVGQEGCFLVADHEEPCAWAVPVKLAVKPCSDDQILLTCMENEDFAAVCVQAYWTLKNAGIRLV